MRRAAVPFLLLLSAQMGEACRPSPGPTPHPRVVAEDVVLADVAPPMLEAVPGVRLGPVRLDMDHAALAALGATFDFNGDARVGLIRVRVDIFGRIAVIAIFLSEQTDGVSALGHHLPSTRNTLDGLSTELPGCDPMVEQNAIRVVSCARSGLRFVQDARPGARVRVEVQRAR